MIFNPLVWRYGVLAKPYQIAAHPRGRWQAYMTEEPFISFGMFKSKGEAQATCERHHQVTRVRELSVQARDILRSHAEWISTIDGAQWATDLLAILDAADEADRLATTTQPKKDV